MFEIVFLGTGGSVPSPKRNLPATFVRHGNKKFLVDCGDGTTRQLVSRSHVRGLGKALTKPLFMLITHEHVDHMLGIGTLFYYLDLTTNAKQVEVYASPLVCERIRIVIDMIDFKSNLQVVVKEISQGPIYEDHEIVCTAFPTHHTSNSYGFLFEERPKRAFLPSAAERLGVPPGPLRRELAAGKAIVLEGGVKVHPEDVLGTPTRGFKLVFLGDTSFDPDLINYCFEADCLVSEALYLENERSLAVKNRHLTARDAAQLAVEAHVKRLFLNHLSTRYTAEAILAEARTIFKDTFVANDFDYIEV